MKQSMTIPYNPNVPRVKTGGNSLVVSGMYVWGEYHMKYVQTSASLLLICFVILFFYGFNELLYISERHK